MLCFAHLLTVCRSSCRCTFVLCDANHVAVELDVRRSLRWVLGWYLVDKVQQYEEALTLKYSVLCILRLCLQPRTSIDSPSVAILAMCVATCSLWEVSQHPNGGVHFHFHFLCVCGHVSVQQILLGLLLPNVLSASIPHLTSLSTPSQSCALNSPRFHVALPSPSRARPHQGAIIRARYWALFSCFLTPKITTF